jgi:hypothetical protein
MKNDKNVPFTIHYADYSDSYTYILRKIEKDGLIKAVRLG